MQVYIHVALTLQIEGMLGNRYESMSNTDKHGYIQFLLFFKLLSMSTCRQYCAWCHCFIGVYL
jgi:hypothetical protein